MHRPEMEQQAMELKVAVAQTSNWMKISGWFRKLKTEEEHLNIEKLSTSVSSVVI